MNIFAVFQNISCFLRDGLKHNYYFDTSKLTSVLNMNTSSSGLRRDFQPLLCVAGKKRAYERFQASSETHDDEIVRVPAPATSTAANITAGHEKECSDIMSDANNDTIVSWLNRQQLEVQLSTFDENNFLAFL